MRKAIQANVKRCAILTFIFIFGIGNTDSFAAGTGTTSLQAQAPDTGQLTKLIASTTPVVPPVIGDTLTSNLATDPTSTIGGTAINKGLEFIQNQIGDPDKINTGTTKVQKILKGLLEGKGNMEKNLSKLKVGTKAYNRQLKALNAKLEKIAQTEELIKGNGKKLQGIKGLKLIGTGMTIYGIYSDADALMKGEYKHNHTSMRFVGDALLGSNIAINGFLLTPWGQVPVIKQGAEFFAIGVGITKDYVNSEAFANYMNSKNNAVLKFSDEVIDNTNAYWTDTFESWLTKWYKYTGAQVSDEELAKAKARHQKWLDYQNKGLGRKPGDNIGAYKPNIYLYPKEETTVKVTFQMPGLLKTVIPQYPGEWVVKAKPNGDLLGADGESYSYLFYESITWPFLYQKEAGWTIRAETGKEQMEEIMYSYGFTKEEVNDFIEYWTVKLDQGEDYAMYPQLKPIVDQAMPIHMEPQPDTMFRLWFAFEKDGVPVKAPLTKMIERKGFTAVEWGGVILP